MASLKEAHGGVKWSIFSDIRSDELSTMARNARRRSDCTASTPAKVPRVSAASRSSRRSLSFAFTERLHQSRHNGHRCATPGGHRQSARHYGRAGRNLWLTEMNGNRIGHFGTADPATITELPPLPTADSQPMEITVGPDSNLWFTESNANQIGRITTSGTVTEVGLPTADSQPAGITAGPDGNLCHQYNANQIGRVTVGGNVMEFAIPTSGSAPQDIAAGSDGHLWFTEATGNNIGRITTGGMVSELRSPPPAVSRTASRRGRTAVFGSREGAR